MNILEDDLILKYIENDILLIKNFGYYYPSPFIIQVANELIKETNKFRFRINFSNTLLENINNEKYIF